VTAELSPGLVLGPTRRAETYLNKRRHDASMPAPVTGTFDAVLNRVASSQAFWLTPVLILQAILCLRMSPSIAALPVFVATALIYLTARRFFGQSGGLLAGLIFALSPATTFAAKFGTAQAVVVMAVAGAIFVATRPSHRLDDVAIVGTVLAMTTTVALLAVLVAVGLGSWHAIAHAVTSTDTSTGATITTVPHSSWMSVVVLMAGSVMAFVVLPVRRTLVVVTAAAALGSVAVAATWQSGAPPQTAIALSVAVLAPVLGGAAAWLVRRGPHLGMRAPAALIAGLLLLSTGMTAATQVIQSQAAAGPVIHAAPPAGGSLTHHAQTRSPQPRGSIGKAALLHPQQKYFGIFATKAPATLAPVHRIAAETGKQPNLDLYYQAWGTAAATGRTNFSTATAEHACNAGMLPMMTWESWNAVAPDRPNATNNWTQRQFAPSRITAGRYDAYIEATAKAISSLDCPIAVRFDQEMNGFWYPWGLGTLGMPGTAAHRAAAYVAMWRHVWQIFQDEGATNVIWVWSPNIQPVDYAGYPPLAASYPGRKYVDWVGIDGYYSPYPGLPDPRFHQVFGSTFELLKAFASDKPWLLAETAVSAGPNQPAQISDLLHHVASDNRLNGFVYFDSDKAHDRADWRFDSTDGASLRAFRRGIGRRIYASGTTPTRDHRTLSR
jgi:mannan endo-1,4-beta-mannosidase